MLAVTMPLKGVLTKMPSLCVRTIMSVPFAENCQSLQSGAEPLKRDTPMLEMV